MYRKRQAGKKSNQGQGKGSKFSTRHGSKRFRKANRGQGKS